MLEWGAFSLRRGGNDTWCSHHRLWQLSSSSREEKGKQFVVATFKSRQIPCGKAPSFPLPPFYVPRVAVYCGCHSNPASLWLTAHQASQHRGEFNPKSKIVFFPLKINLYVFPFSFLKNVNPQHAATAAISVSPPLSHSAHPGFAEVQC